MNPAARSIREILSTTSYGDARFMSVVLFGSIRTAAPLNAHTQQFYRDVRTRVGPSLFDAVADFRGTKSQEATAAGFLVPNRNTMLQQARRAFGWW